jgi:hypothetical protein
MRSILLPATTPVVALAHLQGRYDRVYYRSARGKLHQVSLVPSRPSLGARSKPSVPNV